MNTNPSSPFPSRPDRKVILVTGSQGQVGRDCLEVLSPEFRVVGMTRRDMDLRRRDCVEVLDRVQPDVVVNCAAYTDVDGCEKDQANAWAVNARGPGLLAEWCSHHDRHFVHISSDYVFGSRKPHSFRPYNEADMACPASAYGATKLEGELRVRASSARAAILRTAWVYGAGGNNLLKTLLWKHVQEGRREFRVVADQHGSPTWSWSLARQIREIIRRRSTGLFHAAGEGAATWHDLVVRFFTAMDLSVHVEPCSSEAFPRPAPRPTWSVLDNAALRASQACVLEPWERDVDEFAARHGVSLVRQARALSTRSPRHEILDLSRYRSCRSTA